MKKFYFIALVLMLAISPLHQANAKGGQSWLLGLDLSYLSNKAESVAGGTTTTGELSSTFYDLSLGYMLGSNLYVGGVYATRNDKSTGATLSTSTNGSAMGAAIGYVADNGFHITGIYYLSATDDEYKKGSGMEVDLGWRTFVSSGFFVGAKLAYRSIKYTENASISNFTSYTHTTTMPYITLGMGF
jgi:hypothetical protein